MKHKISVIIPVYNVENYLGKCLNSLIDQSYSNIEIIIINDGSTDNSIQICEEYKNKDNRILIINQENQGVSAARNKGLKHATGDYIIFIDSDDYVSNDYVEFLYNTISNTDSQIAVCGVNDFKDDGVIEKKSKGNLITLKDNDVLKSLLNEKYFHSVIWAKIYKKEVLQNKEFNTNMVIAEDLDFLYNVFKNVNSLTVNTNKCLYYYRKREDSASTDKFNINWKKEIELCERIIQESNTDIYLSAISRYIRINFSCMIKLLRYGEDDSEEYKSLKNNILKYKKNIISNNEISLKLKFRLFILFYFKDILKLLIKR